MHKMNLNQNRQELFRDVFRIKSGHRDLIFEFKNKHKFDQLTKNLSSISRVLGTATKTFNSHNISVVAFNAYNRTIAKWHGSPDWCTPIENMNDLYLILRDYILLSKSLQDGIYSDSAVVNEPCDFFVKNIVRILFNEYDIKSDYLGKIERCEKFNLYTKSILTCFESDSDSD